MLLYKYKLFSMKRYATTTDTMVATTATTTATAATTTTTTTATSIATTTTNTSRAAVLDLSPTLHQKQFIYSKAFSFCRSSLNSQCSMIGKIIINK